MHSSRRCINCIWNLSSNVGDKGISSLLAETQIADQWLQNFVMRQSKRVTRMSMDWYNYYCLMALQNPNLIFREDEFHRRASSNTAAGDEAAGAPGCHVIYLTWQIVCFTSQLLKKCFGLRNYKVIFICFFITKKHNFCNYFCVLPLDHV